MKERPIRRWQFDSVSICLVLLLQLQLLLVLTSAASSASGGRHYGRGGLHPETLELKPPPNSQKKGQTGHSSHRNSMNRNDKLFPFNLFLERQESKRLLGIDVDLFYVKDGVTNEYALRFPVPVPGNMSRLEFSWQNLKPQQQILNYRIEIQLDNPHAMFQPTLDIPTKGVVPEQPESFVVSLRCTGRSNAEVRVTILVDISRAKQKEDDKDRSSQQVKIQRKKVCLKDEKAVSTTTTTLGPAIVDGTDNDADDSEEDQEDADDDELEENHIGAVGDRSADRETSRRKKNSANSATMISDEALGPDNNWGNPWGPNGWPVLLVAGAGAVVTGAALASLLATAVCFMRNQKHKRQNTSITLTSTSKPAGQLVIQAAAEKYCREWVAASTLNGSLYGHALGQGTEVTSMLTMATPPAQPNRGFGHRLMRVSSPVASTIASYSSFRKANQLEVPPSPAPPPPPVMSGLNHFTLKSMGTLNSSAGQYSTIQDLSRSRSSLLSEQLAELAIDSRYLSLVKLLSEGSFGRIYHAVLNDGSNGPARETPVQAQSVLVKTVTTQASSEQVEQFMQEGMMLFGMNHANVHQVVGTCMDLGSQPALIYPAMSEGNLKQFLRRTAATDCGQNSFSPQELVDIAVQIAEGLMYLHRRFFLHKDVATRNCLLDERLHVKLGDNALARDIFPDDYHCLGDGENRPVAWLAIESLQNREFTPASDLWMFGVTLWELMSLGKQPFADVDPAEMGLHLRSGHRLPQPPGTPDELYSLMCRCWCLCPGDRVTLPQATRTLADLYARFDSGSSTGSRAEMNSSREALTSSRRLLVQKHTARRGQSSTVGSTSSFKPNGGTPGPVFRDDEVIYANDVLP